MRGRVLLGVVVVAVGAAIAGCGSSSPGAPANPLASELSYYSANAPFIMTIATNPNSTAIQQANGLLGRNADPAGMPTLI